MRRSYPSLPDPFEERVKRLENDLYMTRTAILGLMPEVLRAALTSYYRIESREESYNWEDATARQIIDSAKLLPRTDAFFGERAMCPLCGDGSSSPYDEGFSIPEGLRRHLVGYGNTHQCVVAKAAFALARDYWNSKFREAEAEAYRASQANVERRKKSEVLYRTELNGTPLLLEEGVAIYREIRSNEDLIWAEKRLDVLGFSVTVADKIKAYTSEVGNFVVFADPREKGEIVFRVFKKPVGTPRRSRTSRAVARFSIPDRWKHDLRAKYEAALNKATE